MVGFIQFEVLNVIYADTMINVVALAVDKQYKGKGIGKKLLKAAEHWGMSIGINYVRLNFSMNREGAHKFYIKQGYENDKVQLRFLKKLSL